MFCAKERRRTQLSILFATLSVLMEIRQERRQKVSIHLTSLENFERLLWYGSWSCDFAIRENCFFTGLINFF
jgi:hypothetical protein